ncbi:hypothetical protein TgHK011_004799 [Trichoderma gracile]|nr:hypothetical protein TgHK011_004799 [Trichoderma gracile]
MATSSNLSLCFVSKINPPSLRACNVYRFRGGLPHPCFGNEVARLSASWAAPASSNNSQWTTSSLLLKQQFVYRWRRPHR